MFDREIAARYDEIQDVLMGFCEKRGLRGMRAEQAVGDTFAVAFEHEAKGEHWDPEREPVEQYLVRILVNHFRKMRRNRLAGAAELNEGASVASDVTAVDVLLIEHEEHAILAPAVSTRRLPRRGARPRGDRGAHGRRPGRAPEGPRARATTRRG